MRYSTSIGTSTSDSITFMGLDLCSDVIGHVDLGSFAFLSVTQRLPTSAESRMLNAILVATADHGLTPSSISARLTHLGAPESIQSAIAGGLLGAGSVYLGAGAQVGAMLRDFMAVPDGDARDAAITEFVDGAVAKRQPIPGFGHPIHRPVDPRTTALFSIARSTGFYGVHCELMQRVHRVLTGTLAREITLNALGACGAILMDMGIPLDTMRMLAVASRAVGLVGQLTEEIAHPIAQQIWMNTMESLDYVADEVR